MYKSKGKGMDMINGPLPKNILLFSLPLAASSILQQLFNSADVAVVGKFAGSEALAAVGSNATVTALFVNIFVGLSIGPNVLIAKHIGEKKNERVQSVVHTSIAFAVICGLCMFILGQIIARPILVAIDTDADVLDKAVLYLRIYFAGMPFIVLYNFAAAILRSVGNTKRPLFCLIISGVINVCLNLIFVIIFKMEVAGVALATSIANAISCGIVIYSLIMEEETIRLKFRNISIKASSLKNMLMVGIPSALQSAVFSISNVLIQRGINYFGADATAGSATALNFEYFTFFVISAFSQACVTFTSQNFGAGKFDRCKRVCKICMIEGMVITIIMSSSFLIGIHPLLRLYTDDETVIEYAIIRMSHVMAIEFLTGTYEITGGALRGMGHSMLPALLTVLGSVCFRILWLFTVFEKYHSFGMLMVVYPVSWIITGTMVVIAYFVISRRVYSR